MNLLFTPHTHLFYNIRNISRGSSSTEFRLKDFGSSHYYQLDSNFLLSVSSPSFLWWEKAFVCLSSLENRDSLEKASLRPDFSDVTSFYNRYFSLSFSRERKTPNAVFLGVRFGTHMSQGRFSDEVASFCFVTEALPLFFQIQKTLKEMAPHLDEIHARSMMSEELQQDFRLFEISDRATLEDVKKAYKEKVSQYHPDKVQALPKEFQQVAHEQMIKFTDAFERLKSFLESHIKPFGEK